MAGIITSRPLIITAISQKLPQPSRKRNSLKPSNWNRYRWDRPQLGWWTPVTSCFPWFQSFQVGWINIVCASFLTWCHPPNYLVFFCEYRGKQFPFNFRVRASFAKSIHVWRLVPVWLDSRFDLAILYHFIGSLCFVNGNKTPSCLQSLLWVFVSLCVWYSMFSSSGLLVHINLYQLHFVLYLHHFLPTYCVILPQECCLLLKVVRRTWNNHLHVIQHDSSWKRAEVCYATPTKTRAAWPSFRQERETKAPILDAEFDWSCNWMIWILVRFQWERRLGFGL